MTKDKSEAMAEVAQQAPSETPISESQPQLPTNQHPEIVKTTGPITAARGKSALSPEEEAALEKAASETGMSIPDDQTEVSDEQGDQEKSEIPSEPEPPAEPRMCLVDSSQEEGCFDLVFHPDGNRQTIPYEALFMEDPDTMELLDDVARTCRICFRGFIDCGTVQEAVKKRGQDKKYEHLINPRDRVRKPEKPNWNNFFCKNCNHKAGDDYPVVHIKNDDGSEGIYVCSYCFMGYDPVGDMVGDQSNRQRDVLAFVELQRRRKQESADSHQPRVQAQPVDRTVFGSADQMHRGSGGGRQIPGRRGLPQ